jgi:methane/ammonia monooxygenase subunit B
MNKTLLKYLIPLTLIGMVFMFHMQTAMAHGEKNLEPFIRMRSIQWYDVQWSKQKLNVNDEVVITGKFHVAEDWPSSVPKPDATFLSVATPGPVFIRTERYLNGKPWVNSSALQLGGDYDFKIVLKGRVPGKYHIHPFFSLQDAGQVMGPGEWLEIAGNASDFSNKLTTINGNVIDMETYGFSKGALWHLFWGALATGWLLWWLRRPLFIPRFRMTEAGMETELVTQQDRNIAKVLLVAVPIIVLTANQMARTNIPIRFHYKRE